MHIFAHRIWLQRVNATPILLCGAASNAPCLVCIRPTIGNVFELGLRFALRAWYRWLPKGKHRADLVERQYRHTARCLSVYNITNRSGRPAHDLSRDAGRVSHRRFYAYAADCRLRSESAPFLLRLFCHGAFGRLTTPSCND